MLPRHARHWKRKRRRWPKGWPAVTLPGHTPLRLGTCAEAADLSAWGIAHNACADPVLISHLCPEDADIQRFCSLDPAHAQLLPVAPLTRAAGKLASTSAARASRLKSSSALNARKRQLRGSASLMKSTDQRALTTGCAPRRTGARPGSRRFPLRRMFKRMSINPVDAFVVPCIPLTTDTARLLANPHRWWRSASPGSAVMTRLPSRGAGLQANTLRLMCNAAHALLTESPCPL